MYVTKCDSKTEFSGCTFVPSSPKDDYFFLSHRWDINTLNIPSSYCKTDPSLDRLDDGLIIKTLIKLSPPFCIPPVGPLGPLRQKG